MQKPSRIPLLAPTFKATNRSVAVILLRIALTGR
jgi:hypothetical protein